MLNINFYEFEIKRAIVHRITEKGLGQDHGNIVESKHITLLDEEVKAKIQDRLQDAIQRTTKTFDLLVGDTSESGFFGYAKDLPEASDNDFVKHTTKMALMLSQAMTSPSIPGGYLIVLEGRRHDSGLECVIALKTDLHEAMIYASDQVSLLKNVFLSPSLKLYKFGALIRRTKEEQEDFAELDEINREWAALLFDDQFRLEGKLADYFHKDFLGFSIDKNSKLQTKRFYDMTEQFIINNVIDSEKKNGLLKVLDHEFIGNTEFLLSPGDFADAYLGENVLHEQYEGTVSSFLPESIQKDTTLIRARIMNKRISFPNGIRIAGSQQALDANLEIISDNSSLSALDAESELYTLVKIKGKAFFS